MEPTTSPATTTIAGTLKPRRLQIQSILYGNGSHELARAITSVTQAAKLAREADLYSEIVVSWGDCSPQPLFTDEQVEQQLAALQDSGINLFRYEFFNENLGSAAGHNRLLASRSFDHVIIANPDTLLAPDCIVELNAGMVLIGSGIVEARQLPIEHPKAYDSNTFETSWASTACVLVSADVLDAISGFDAENFFLYCDDVDFSWRARLSGFKVIYYPSARIFHDKRLDEFGHLVPSAPEIFYSVEGALMLTHKYSRPKLHAKVISDLTENGSTEQKRAVAAFQKRSLPVPIDTDHHVGQFIKGNYAKHRF
jgi:GT2 family glycosyltransferase